MTIVLLCSCQSIMSLAYQKRLDQLTKSVVRDTTEDDQPLKPKTSFARLITVLSAGCPSPTFTHLSTLLYSCQVSEGTVHDRARAHLSLGPPPGPGLWVTYSGPSFFASLTCNAAILSSDHCDNLDGPPSVLLAPT